MQHWCCAKKTTRMREKNRNFGQRLKSLREEKGLKQTDAAAKLGISYSSLQDLFFIKQGFESKILHTVTHMLDGFIGVDSAFYNLIEDSHWLSPSLRREITSHMHEYWLVRVVAGEVREAILHQTPLTTGAKGQ